MKTKPHILLIYFIIISYFGYSQTYNLTVTVTNIKKLEGNIIVSIYNKTSDFPHKGEFQSFSSVVNKFSETVIIKNLPEGEYAIATFHDDNSDGECNTNFLGFAKEGYGFSKNVKPKLSAPSFDDCKIDLSNNKTIIIELR